MSALDVVVAALALWRMAALLAYERGPLDVFMRLRTWAGITHDDTGTPDARTNDGWLSGILYCVWCLSLNVAAPLALLWLLWPAGAFWICLPFALSAGAVLTERVAHG